jgi:5'-3' exonuclease
MYAAALCSNGIVNTVVSNDADALLFGSPHVTKQMQLSAGKILRATLSDFEKSLQLDLELLRDLAIVSGCDFHREGVKGIGPRRGSVLLQKHGGLEGLLKARGFIASERADYLEARRVFDEASYLSIKKVEFRLNPPLIPKVLRALETVMPADRAEYITQNLTNLWKSFGNRQSTLEQWL